MTPNDLSLGLLADLVLYWEAGECSRMFLAEITGVHPDDLQGMRDAAMARAGAYVESIVASRKAGGTPGPASSSPTAHPSTGTSSSSIRGSESSAPGAKSPSGDRTLRKNLVVEITLGGGNRPAP